MSSNTTDLSELRSVRHYPRGATPNAVAHTADERIEVIGGTATSDIAGSDQEAELMTCLSPSTF